MSTVPPVPPGPSASSSTRLPPPSRPRAGLSPRVWWVVAAGFGIGLVLFLLLWLDMRKEGEFYRPEGKATGTEGQAFEPLPAPVSGDGRSASGLSEAAENAARNPRPLPPPVQAPQAANPAVPSAGPVAGVPVQGASPTPALAPGSVPVAISRPPPEYPAEALRRNESGTVQVRIEVGSDGVPVAVAVVGRSGSRSLDRAAVQAAKRWRFRPAQQNGQPVSGAVEAPITFKLEGG